MPETLADFGPAPLPLHISKESKSSGGYVCALPWYNCWICVLMGACAVNSVPCQRLTQVSRLVEGFSYRLAFGVMQTAKVLL